jgi:hypothetical protein
LVAIAIVTAMALLPACAAAPRERPIELGPVDTGPGSVEHARRTLEGTWNLERFDVMDTSGRLVPVKAQAVLVYDAYGNLRVTGGLQEPMPGASPFQPRAMLDYSGRMVIDPDRSEFRLQDPEGKTPVDPDLAEAIGQQRVRHYEIIGDQLTISYLNSDGGIVATTTFRRAAGR